MIFKRRSSPKNDDGLGPRGEALWDELQGRIEDGERFVWCFVSTASPRASNLFMRRLRGLAKGRNQKVSLKETALPSRLPKLSRGLVQGRWVARYDYIWLQASDSVRNQLDSDWQRAWMDALRFLSARRRELEERFRGIIVSGPPELQQWLPEAVPSIWPLQPLTIELRPSWLRSAAPENSPEEGAGEPAAKRPDVNGEDSGAAVDEAASVLDERLNEPSLEPLADGEGLPASPVSAMDEAEDEIQVEGAAPAEEETRRAADLSDEESAGEGTPSAPQAAQGPAGEPIGGGEEDKAVPPDPQRSSDRAGEAPPHVGADDRPDDQDADAGLPDDSSGDLNLEAEAARATPGERLREAVEAFRRGDLARTVELTRDISRSAASPARRAEAYALRAQAERRAGRLADAARDISLALSTLDTQDRGDLLRWFDLAGQIALRRHRLEEALDYYQRALKTARQRAESQPGPATRRSLSVILNRLGEVQMRRGENHHARGLCQEALQLRRQLVEDADQPTPASLRDLSYCYYLLAMVEESGGRLEAALDQIRESLILDRRISDEAPGPDSRRNLTATLKLAAHLKRRMGHEGESLRLLRQAADLGSDDESSA